MNQKIIHLLKRLKQAGEPIMYTKEDIFNNHTEKIETLHFTEKVHRDNLENEDIGEHKTENDVISCLTHILAKTLCNKE